MQEVAASILFFRKVPISLEVLICGRHHPSVLPNSFLMFHRQEQIHAGLLKGKMFVCGRSPHFYRGFFAPPLFHVVFASLSRRSHSASNKFLHFLNFFLTRLFSHFPCLQIFITKMGNICQAYFLRTVFHMGIFLNSRILTSSSSSFFRLLAL